jgi:hypothetical protein
MLKVTVQNHQLHFGEHFAVSFQRTLRIPDDGNTYPLPPGLGMFPVYQVEDYGDRVPDSWRQHGGVFIPMYQREALWLNFQAAHWQPNAVKVAIGKVNAITGKPWEQGLHDAPQDYLVCPDQPWLDGINAGDGYIRQFVAMPLGMGYTVEAQVTGKEEFGGIQMIVFEPKPGRFPDQPPAPRRQMMMTFAACAPSAPMAGAEMGLGAGGKMRQKIYPDKHGLDTWDVENYGRVYVHIVNSMMYREITGKEPPKTPISAKTYTQHGFPWFDLYDEQEQDIPKSTTLSQIKTIKEMDQEKGFSPQQDDTPIEVSDSQVKVLKSDPTLVEDGEW